MSHGTEIEVPTRSRSRIVEYGWRGISLCLKKTDGLSQCLEARHQNKRHGTQGVASTVRSAFEHGRTAVPCTRDSMTRTATKPRASSPLFYEKVASLVKS